MYVLCIHYTLDPNKVEAFRTYVANESAVITRSGGHIIGYFGPTDFAGPNSEAYGLISFDSLASYEAYRDKLAADPVHKVNADALILSGACLRMERSILNRMRDTPVAA